MPPKAPPITDCLYSSVSGLCAHSHFSYVDSMYAYTPWSHSGYSTHMQDGKATVV